MIIYQCRACGAEIQIEGNERVCICQYCQTKQALPVLESDRLVNLYDRANHFYRNDDFDRARDLYEEILNENPEDAESYWSLVLCKFGVEYVTDQRTGKRVPTVNRTQYTSILVDEDYKAALRYATEEQREIYEQDAQTIEQIQKGILEISEKEKPYDVFICYKETDAEGHRSTESVLSQEIYQLLTEAGFKVFYSRITLEDKLGTEYEPYIFAALNSSKVMVVVGTKPEHFEAPWVKNEWSRFLTLIKKGEKKVLIPAYKGMNPYALPADFSHLQAQDMSKLGFMQDLKKSIQRIMDADKPKPVIKETVIIRQNGRVGKKSALLDRGYMAVEDGEWEEADGFFDDVLFQDPKNSQAYLGKFMISQKVRNEEELIDLYVDKFDPSMYQKIPACMEKTNLIDSYVQKYTIKGFFDEKAIRDRFENDRCYNSYYDTAVKQKELIQASLDDNSFWSKAVQYASEDESKKLNLIKSEIMHRIQVFVDESRVKDNIAQNEIQEKYEEFCQITCNEVEKNYEVSLERREKEYQLLVEEFEDPDTYKNYDTMKTKFEKFYGYRDSAEYAQECQMEINRQEIERHNRILAEERKKTIKSILLIAAPIVIILLIIILV